MTSLDRTPVGTGNSVRAYAWATVVTTLATLATVLVLALTGNQAFLSDLCDVQPARGHAETGLRA